MNPDAVAALPPEVALSEEVHNCRDCQWMWPRDPASSPGNGVYGVLPVTQAWKKPAGTFTWKGEIDAGFPDPAAIVGCRKAPVMTIGINPNLQSFFNVPTRLMKPSSYAGRVSDKVRSVYPRFANSADYAEYHRYYKAGENQLQMSEADWEACLSEKVTTSIDLELCGDRDPAGRQLRYFARPADSTAPGQVSLIKWQARENRFVYRARPKAGESYAGKIDEASLRGATVRLSHRSMTYFQTIEGICSRLGLLPGEDLAMHDMVACATPGWKDEFRIDKKELLGNCQDKNRFLQRQVEQTRPALIFFAGKESFAAFVRLFKPWISGEPQGAEWSNDIFKLMQLCAQRPVLVKKPMSSPEDVWECRLLPMPHFSYPDNYKPHVRMDSHQWKEMLALSPGLQEELMALNEADPEGDAVFAMGAAPVNTCPIPQPAPWTQGPGAAQTQALVAQHGAMTYTIALEANKPLSGVAASATPEADALASNLWVDPLVLAQQVYDERVAAGHIMPRNASPTAGQGKLQRAEGTCSYCTHYQLTGGCLYPEVPHNTET